MFEHVLVPLDESALAEQVLPHVVLAARLGSPTVTLVRVLEPPASGGAGHPADPVDWQLGRDRAQSYVAGVQRRLEEAGVAANVVVIEGDPATSILQLIHDYDVDLLAMTTHGRGGLVGHNLGSVAGKTIVRARTNLLLVRSLRPARDAVDTVPTATPYDGVVVPLDGSLRAEAALPVAVRIGNQVSAPLLLTHYVKDAAAVRTHLPDENEAVRRDDYRESQHLAAQTYLDRLCKDQGGNGLRVSAEVVGGGDAAPVLEALAGGIDNGLMVLAAHGESGSTSSPYGSTVLHALVYGGTTLLVVQDRDRDELAESHTERAARERQGHG